MRASVPALPAHCTSMRRAPAAASTSTAMLTSHLARQDEQPDDERHAPLHHERDAGDDEQDPVGHRVEHLAQVRPLVEVAGDPAVDPVGRAEHREQRRRLDPLVVGEQPEEDGHAQEARHRDEIGDRDDPRASRSLRSTTRRF